MSVLRGGCHCGALTVELTTSVDPDALELRECQCTFCRKHVTCNTSDAGGRAHIVAEAEALERYSFGLHTADFLVCRRCGVYIGCIVDDAFFSVNTRALDYAFAQATVKSDWSAEDAETRKARRRTRWTPATLELR